MKLANVIIPAKEFLFDTWYGALTVWCGASALLVAMLLLDLPFAGRIWWSSIAPYVGYALLLLLLIAGIVFIAAWIVSLVKRRWKQAIVQLALGVIWTAGLLYAAAMLLFASMFGPSEDHFADELTIPPEVAENIIEPESGFEGSHFGTIDVYDDDFALSVFKCLTNDGCDDDMVTCDLSELAALVHNRRDELMAYLARHPGWWLHEDHGCLSATRRLRLRGGWNHPLGGYYSGNSRKVHPNEDYEAYYKQTRYQMRTTIGFPYSPFGRKREAEHPVTTTVKASLREWEDSVSPSANFTSCMSFGDKDFCVEVFEQTTVRARRITNASLSFLQAEFAAFKLPEDAIKRGPEEFVLRDGMQPGIYNLTLRLNPGEPGVTYLKAYEVTKETRLSEGRLYDRSNERIGWSQDPEEKFLYENEFTIYEGDWGKPYAARIEVWFRPDTGKPERKLTERICKIEGWQR